MASILVTGATGRHGGTGGDLVTALLAAGRTVRVLVRRLDERADRLRTLGAETVVGDLTDRAGLIAALDGVEQVYFTYPIDTGVLPAAATMASAAREQQQPPRIVVMSMGPAAAGSPSHLGRAQWLAEEVLDWAGLQPVVLRVAGFFHENIATLHGRSIRQAGVIRNSFGDARLPWISGRDAARIAFAALTRPQQFPAGTHLIPGVELLSHTEIAAVLADRLARPVRFTPVDGPSWRADLMQLAADGEPAVNAHMARHITALAAAASTPGWAPAGIPGAAAVEQLTGHRPLTFADFVDLHATRFAPE